MKRLSTLFLLLLIYCVSFAKPIDEATAKKVGQHFLATRAHNPLAAAQLSLALKAGSMAYNPNATATGINYYYIFNVTNGDGFIIVAADDNATPVLGYSNEVDFDATNIAPQTAKWLEGYKNQIRYIIQNNIKQTDEIKNDWAELIKDPGNISILNASVSPLLKTKWDQSPYYNSLCPYDNSASEKTVTGCVATAMAQVMKFWSYPSTGTGNHSYNHSRYGTLAANFGSTTYSWGSMPNTVSSSNSAVATLMYHAGVSVDMNYDIGSRGGSGAYVITSQSPVTHCTEYALKTYFGYKSSLKGVERVNYTQSQWLSLMKGELDAGRPVIYAGFGSGGGHCFVTDGYDNNDFLHFNWGWSGQYDGYFSVNALNPLGVGTGGGTGGFNSGHQAVIGIEPPTGGGTSTLDMRLYSNITVNPDPIKYSQAFSVTVNFANYGTTTAQNFSGDYTVAVFNSNNDFVATVETKTGLNLSFNSYYVNPLVFSTTGLSELTPGTYTIGVYYKPTGGSNWVAFADGNYKNFISVNVEGNNTNTLKLYAAVTTSPTIIVRNKTFTVDFDIANFGFSTFTGDVSVDIHKSDGTWIRELDIKNGLTLPSNTHFTNGLSYTITGGLPDEAGTYQLFIWDKPDGGTWEFLGNGAYANPITIQVVEPSLNPDIYEVNNTVQTSYNLPVTFTGNSATVSTPGANCHVGNDYDYYKMVLPAGYNYSIAARIHDVYNTGNGNTYTFDGLISYSTDGTTWSDAYDDIIGNNITVKGGGTVYFYVSPYFTGATGTYLFEAIMSRSAALSSAKDITGFTVSGIVGNALIDPVAATVDVLVSAQTNITSLIPTITVSNLASINPPSGAVINFTNPVVYTVTAQDGTTKTWNVTVTKKSNVGISSIDKLDGIAVYPNPANNELFVDANNFGGLVTSITITNMQGQTILATTNTVGAVTKLQLSGLQSGFYVVQIQTNQGTITKKVLKQ
jgi:hypothetical protein